MSRSGAASGALFVNNYWGEKHNGFDALYSNFNAHSCQATNELLAFLRDYQQLEDSHHKGLLKLSKRLAASKAVAGGTGSFSPCWDVLLAAVEQMASAHADLATNGLTLVRDVQKHSEEQQRAVKSFKDTDNQRTMNNSATAKTCFGMVQNKRQACQTRHLEARKVITSESASEKEKKKAMSKLEAAIKDFRFNVEKYNHARNAFEEGMRKSCAYFEETEIKHLESMLSFVSRFAQPLGSAGRQLVDAQCNIERQLEANSVDRLLVLFVERTRTGSTVPRPVSDSSEQFLDFSSPLPDGAGAAGGLASHNDYGSGSQLSIDRLSHHSASISGGGGGGASSVRQSLEPDLMSMDPVSPMPQPLPSSAQLFSQSSSGSTEQQQQQQQRDDAVNAKVKRGGIIGNILNHGRRSRNRDTSSAVVASGSGVAAAPAETLLSGSSNAATEQRVDAEGYIIRDDEDNPWRSKKPAKSGSSSSDSDSDSDQEKKIDVRIKEEKKPVANTDEIVNVTTSMKLFGPSPSAAMFRPSSRTGASSGNSVFPSFDPNGSGGIERPPSRARPRPKTPDWSRGGAGAFQQQRQRRQSVDPFDFGAFDGNSFEQNIKQQQQQQQEQSPMPSMPPPPPPQAQSASSPPSHPPPSLPAPPLPPVSRPLDRSDREPAPLNALLTETIHCRWSGDQCKFRVQGSLTLSFPASQLLSRLSQPLPGLLFRLCDTGLLGQHRASSRLVKEEFAESNSLQLTVDPAALAEELKRLARERPGVQFLSMEVLTYDLQLPIVTPGPVFVRACWNCEPEHTDLRVELNRHPTSALLVEKVSVSAEVSGGVLDMQSLPAGRWLPDTRLSIWEAVVPASPTDRTVLKAKFLLSGGPTVPGPVRVQFMLDNSSFSDCSFALVGSSYRLDVNKRRIVSGQYSAEPSAVAPL